MNSLGSGFTMVLLAAAALPAWAGKGGGNGTFECEGRLQRSQRIALSILSQVSKERLFQTTYSDRAKAFVLGHAFAQNASSYAASLKAAKYTPTEEELTDERDGADLPMQAMAFPSKNEIQLNIDYCNDTNDFSLAQVLLHETGHLLTPGKKGKALETLLWEAANAIVEAASPPSVPVIRKKTLDEAMDDADPTYKKYLKPLQFPMSRVTEAYDLFEPARRGVLTKFSAAIGAMSPDRNGIFHLKIQTAYAGYAEVYARAVEQAYGPHTGLKMAGSALMENYTMVSLTGAMYSNGNYTLDILMVADPTSNQKVEVLKAQSFQRMEDALSHIRNVVTKQIVADQKEYEALSAAFGSDVSDAAILEQFKKTRGAISILNMAFQRMSIDELRKSLPADVALRKAYLSELVKNTEKQLDLLISTVDQGATSERQSQINELLKWQRELREFALSGGL